jgi:UDP-glucuronate 4-epimerase
VAGEPLSLYGGGKLKRDWTYIDDIVTGFVAALDKRLACEILNLGCSRPVENLQFVSILEKLLNRKASVVDAPTPSSEPLITYADVSKAGRLIGYEPKITVDVGLKRFVDWMAAEKLI